MDVKTQEKSQEAVRKEILDAAETRFRSYGYGKTTMAEIAHDVDMSAANLYRYFENKHDIAAACANRCMGNRVERLRHAVRQPGLSARQRLEAFVLETFRHTQEETENQPKINELVAAVTSKSKEIVHAKIQQQVALISEILAYGNETGEFEVEDVISSARAVYASLTLFEVPIFAALYPYDEFEQIARDVVALLIQGLAKR